MTYFSLRLAGNAQIQSYVIAAVFLLFLPGLSSSAEVRPFGIEFGSPPSNYDSAPSPDALRTKNENGIWGTLFGNRAEDHYSSQYIVPPDPHPDFVAYKIKSSIQSGICSVTATSLTRRFGTMHKNDTSIGDLFQKIRAQIDAKYGNSSLRKFSSQGNSYSELGTPELDLTTTSFWKVGKSDSETFSIELSFTTSENPNVSGYTPLELTYIAPNFEQCLRQNTGTDEESMSDGTSKF